MQMIRGGWRSRDIAMLVAMVCAVPWAAGAAPPKAPLPAPTSSFVYDIGQGTVQVAERADTVRPIASLTKLMTAMVFLDSRTSLDRTIAYDPKRHVAYRNWMSFAAGDRVRARELWYMMLVGSQNIPARMLVALSPYPEAQFVARMNAKAAALGLTHTRFVDVHGLNPKNVSTVAEVARMFEVALTYPDIRDALAREEAVTSWTSRRGAVKRRAFAHTNILLASRQRFAITASKTGYLNEAGDALVMRVRDPASQREFVVVTLGETRRAPRFAIAKRLAEAAVGATRIAGWKSE